MTIQLSEAIQTTAEVVDWERLGEFLAEQDSSDQAYALVGFWANVSDRQLAFIGNSGVFGGVHESTRQEVADFYRGLADAIERSGR